jgi:hypothetical protein
MYSEYNEQIDKSNYYNEQSGGRLDIPLYSRVSRQRGRGLLSNLIGRFAYPFAKFLGRQALPLVGDLVQDVIPGFQQAKSNLKLRASKTLKDLGDKIEHSGFGKKRRKKRRMTYVSNLKRIKVMKGKGRRKKRTSPKRKTTRKRTTKKRNTRRGRRTTKKLFDIFK